MINDAVFDTAVIAIGNGDISDKNIRNSFDNISSLLHKISAGTIRVRWNNKLRSEYDNYFIRIKQKTRFRLESHDAMQLHREQVNLEQANRRAKSEFFD